MLSKEISGRLVEWKSIEALRRKMAQEGRKARRQNSDNTMSSNPTKEEKEEDMTSVVKQNEQCQAG
jgi:hypothetical protein